MIYDLFKLQLKFINFLKFENIFDPVIRVISVLNNLLFDFDRFQILIEYSILDYFQCR